MFIRFVRAPLVGNVGRRLVYIELAVRVGVLAIPRRYRTMIVVNRPIPSQLVSMVASVFRKVDRLGVFAIFPKDRTRLENARGQWRDM